MKFKILITMAFISALLTTVALKAEEPKVMSPQSRGEMKPGHTVEDHKMETRMSREPQDKARPEFGDDFSKDPKIVNGANVNFYDVWTIQNGLFQDSPAIFYNGTAMDLILMDCKKFCDDTPEKCGAIDANAISQYKYLALRALPGDRKEFLKCFGDGIRRRDVKLPENDIKNDVCNLSCSGKGFLHDNACGNPQRLRQCMLVCCNLGERYIENCMKSNGDKHCSEVK